MQTPSELLVISAAHSGEAARIPAFDPVSGVDGENQSEAKRRACGPAGDLLDGSFGASTGWGARGGTDAARAAPGGDAQRA